MNGKSPVTVPWSWGSLSPTVKRHLGFGDRIREEWEEAYGFCTIFELLWRFFIYLYLSDFPNLEYTLDPKVSWQSHFFLQLPWCSTPTITEVHSRWPQYFLVSFTELLCPLQCLHSQSSWCINSLTRGPSVNPTKQTLCLTDFKTLLESPNGGSENGEC